MSKAIQQLEDALEANHGLQFLVARSVGKGDLAEEITASVLESREIAARQVAAMAPREMQRYCAKQASSMKRNFLAIYRETGFALLKGDGEAAWKLFAKGWRRTSRQLWLSLPEAREHVKLEMVAHGLGVDIAYFDRIPSSTMFIVGGYGEGLHVDVVIPPRLAFLDCAMALADAGTTHGELLAYCEANRIREIPGWLRARLDSRCRLTVVTAANACESVLLDHADSEPAPKTVGLSERLERMLDQTDSGSRECVRDMLSIVRSRNRIVHLDGRHSQWNATRLDFALLGASVRAVPYMTYAPYGVPGSDVGLEYCFARFAFDTAVEVADLLHREQYPDEAFPVWLGFPRDGQGRVDFVRLRATEPMLGPDGGRLH